MRYLAAMAILVSALLGAGTLYGSQDLGPPSPLGAYHELSWAFGYHNYSSDWEADTPGTPTPEIKQNNYWLQIAYTFVDNWEAYGRFGLADARIKEFFPFDPPKDFEAGYSFNFGLGFRGLFYQTPTWGIGPVLQATFYSDYEVEEEGTLPEIALSDYAIVNARFKDLMDLSIGVAAQVNAGKGLLYAGVFGYWTDAKGWEEFQIIEPDPLPPERSRVDLNEEGNLSGYLGVRYPLGSAFSLHVEGQYKSKASFGITLSQKLGDFFD